MRTLLATSTLLLITTTLPGLAAANLYHAPCGYSTLSLGNNVKVDVWAGSCAGVVVWSPLVECLDGVHLDAVGTHTLVLYADGCETGEIVELP